ncbi:MAG TPA: DNA polymerase III subunit alpha [Anaerolineae bacterium]|nr:DNA polymerase III subunit alpha [Anaerolineae bacterium]
MMCAHYIELHAHSSHSLLDGVVSPQSLVAHAASLGMPALALTDHDGLYGAVPFIRAAEAAGVKPLLGAEVTLADGDSTAHLTLLAETPRGYANLCQLITFAHRGQSKGTARLALSDLAEHTVGLIALSGCRQGAIVKRIIAGAYDAALEIAQGYARIFGPESFFIEIQRHYHPGEMRLLGHLVGLADRLRLPVVATGDVHYLYPEQREVHDILTCIRHHVTLEDAGDLLRPNDEYRFRTPDEMAALFANVPAAITNTRVIADRCASAATFLPGGAQVLPAFPTPDGSPAATYLRHLCQSALRACYFNFIKPQTQLEHELSVIHAMHLDDYFLTVWDIVRFAREHGIRCQGRGSAANSLVAYLLDITPIDPLAADLVFERFLSPERRSPPDIDLDIAADRREEVIQYVMQRYGSDHAAMACTLVTFHARSAVRDVGRALGFPPALLERLVGALDVNDPQSVTASPALQTAVGADLDSPLFQHLLRLVPQLDGLPRHLGIHNGGMVLSGPALDTLIPLEPATLPGRIVTQWDKEGLEDAGYVKVDLLGLRMLSAIEDAVCIVEALTGERPELERLTFDDPAVYEMLCRGETIGVFQLESRAQAELVRNFRPQCFADLTVEIALIRPGPLQANVVRPYLRRRYGQEPVRYVHPLLKPALAETLGVMIFQEQALKVAHDLAGFTPGEAEQLRRCLGRKRAEETLQQFKAQFFAGAQANGVSSKIIETVFTQMQAFGSYAFPKSHAAAFAVLTYHSAWLRCYHPAAFFAGLLRHQPMGFYSPRVIVDEARRCGIQIFGADVQASDVSATADGSGIRLGLATVSGVGESGGAQIVAAREYGPFTSLIDFCQRTRLGRRAVEALILGGAFDGWRIPRRQLVWDLGAAMETIGGPPQLDVVEPGVRPAFPRATDTERLWMEVTTTGVTAQGHLVQTVAQTLRAMGVTPVQELTQWPDGTKLRVGGVIIARQRPPTARGTAFIALEDEGGVVNVVLRPEVFAAYREVLRSRFAVVEGVLQWQGRACSVVGERVLAVEG